MLYSTNIWKRGNVNHLVRSAGIEPASPASEASVLSTVLRARKLMLNASKCSVQGESDTVNSRIECSRRFNRLTTKT